MKKFSSLAGGCACGDPACQYNAIAYAVRATEKRPEDDKRGWWAARTDVYALAGEMEKIAPAAAAAQSAAR